MNHKIGRVVFAVAVGLLVATFSYRWITNPDGREQRILQVGVVESSRTHIRALVDSGSLEIVDPVSPNRKVGKVYVYPDGEAWSVSGFYRRGEGDRWHAYLMALDAELALLSLKIQDSEPGLLERAALDPLLEIRP